MRRHLVDDFIQALAGASDEEAAREVFKAAIAQADLETYAYVGLRIPGAGDRSAPFVLTTFPDKWIEAYEKGDYKQIDPVLMETPGQLTPWIWGGEAHRKRVSEPQKRFMDEALEYGIRTGIAIPVHAAGGELGMISISSNEHEAGFQKLMQEYQHDLHLISLYYHTHVSKFIDRSGDATPSLTLRERECLLWSARGKSSWEIGQVLHLSEATVNFHTKNAMRKLGVHSRPHAVVRAITLGLISP